MTPLIADAPTPNANTVWMVIVALSGVLANVLTAVCTYFLAKAAYRRQQVDVSSLPDRTLQIEFAKRFAEKHELEEHAKKNEEDFRRVESQRQIDLVAASGSRKLTYEKIEATRKELYDKVEETRADLTDKIEDVPDRIVAMLRNFGVIGGGKHS